MAKRWKHLRKTVPPLNNDLGPNAEELRRALLEGEINYSDVAETLDSAKDWMSKTPKISHFDDTVEALLAIRGIKSAVAQAEKHINFLEGMLIEAIINYFDEQGIENTSTDLAKISRSDEPHPAVDDKDALRAWAMEHGYDDMLTLPWSTLKKVTKIELENNDPPPDRCIAIPQVRTFCPETLREGNA